MFNEEQVCKHTDNAVKAYVADIIAAATSFEDYSGELDVGYHSCFNTAKTRHASTATITSELGVVVVMPDFRRRSARAAVLNLGVINAMQKEGFDEEYIERKGDIYGNLLAKSTQAAEMFGYYLTHRVGPDFNANNFVEDKED